MPELILFCAVIICLILVIVYRFKAIKKKNSKPSSIKWLSVFLPFLLLILLLKSVFIGSFKITTPSMLSTLEVGDSIFVNKLTYGIRSPISQKKIISLSAPKRGDAVIFYWSENNKTPQLKRVIGLPGDKIELLDKQLVINNKDMPTRYYGEYEAPNDETEYLIFNEDIPTGDGNNFVYSSMILEYDHYLSTDGNATWTVPQGQYFVLGDNRDNSIDSRTQGFVSAKNIIGKAIFVWSNWDRTKGFNGIKFSRFAKPVTYSLPETIPE